MPLQKTCNRCKETKAADAFYVNTRMRDGLNTFCKVCHRADNIKRKRTNRAQPDFVRQEREVKAVYRSRTVAQRANYMAAWREANRQQTLEYGKKYRDANKARYVFLTQKRKIDLINRTPAWLSEDDLWCIEEAYHLAALRTQLLGVRFHVDHTIPLRGKTVSGLHVPNNLRVVPALENMRKTNKYEV